MSSPRLATPAGFVLAACVLLAPVAATSTTMYYLDIEALTQISDLVVRGVVVDSRVFVGDHGRITTEWTVRVDQTLLGESHEEVRFRQWAGELDGIVEHIAGDASFEPGEHVVLFLSGEGPDELFLSALGQSKFTIDLAALPSSPAGDELLRLPSLLSGLLTLEERTTGGAGEVPRSAVAIRNLADIGILPREGGEIVPMAPERISLGELVDRVRATPAGAER